MRRAWQHAEMYAVLVISGIVFNILQKVKDRVMVNMSTFAEAGSLLSHSRPVAFDPCSQVAISIVVCTAMLLACRMFFLICGVHRILPRSGLYKLCGGGGAPFDDSEKALRVMESIPVS